ncbi:MAG TPA: response regulator transcription factor [Tepidisphaeraceae bacterium]|nr:response regulator transcription factor [Tepidisphaeraceae bacterium]
MNVYLIDDDAALRQAVARFVERFGLEVLGEAPNGDEALRALVDARLGLRPDLIISDCQMPVMDGLSFARRFRALGRATPMLMLSGQDDAEVVVAAIDAGFNAFVPKPVTGPLLADAIRLVLPDFPLAA